MTTLDHLRRNVAAIAIAGITPAEIVGGPPIFEMVDPATLLIDDSYQRNLSERSIRLIRKIVAEFDWNKFVPPVVVLTDAGPEVIDGQHRAIAAASHPRVDEIPVMIVEAPERAGRASAFLGLNRDRIGVTALQVHAAAVTAGEDGALAVARACKLADVQIVRTQPKQFEKRQTMAVTAIAALIKLRGADAAALYLKVLADAGCCPITATQLKAVDLLLADSEYNQQINPAKLTGVVTAMGPAAEQEAKVFTAAHVSVPLWKALAITWFKNRQKRVGAPPAAKASPPADNTAPPPARGTWAPGPFMRRCARCDQTFTGAKAALTCSICEYADG